MSQPTDSNSPGARPALHPRTSATRVLLALAGLIFSPWIAARDTKPNVVLILTDDQGSVDAGVYGASDLETPSIDALARRGVRFTQFYAAAPVCSPSRAAILTGRVPQRAGVPNNAPSESGKAGMPAEQVTVAEMLREAGYATGHVGKWHLGYTPETMPNGQGFDRSYGHMGGCIDNYSHFFYWQGPNRHDLHSDGVEVHEPGEFFPDLMVREATRFIEANREKPFFLYFAMNTPHYPYQGDPQWLERYRSLESPRSLYAAFLSTLDARIGKLIEKIDSLGLREDTIIIFQSDHGHSTEERAHFGGGSAGPYRGAKFSLYEGGIRVPAIVSWPGRLPESEVRTQLATGCDWLPTIAELTGATLPAHRLDGRSLAAVLGSASAESPHESFHWALGDQWAVREGRWKLLANPRDTSDGRNVRTLGGETFLFDLSTDVSERTSLAAAHPDVVERLQALHTRWVSEWNEEQKEP